MARFIIDKKNWNFASSTFL